MPDVSIMLILYILRPVKFAENETGIIPKFNHKTRYDKDRLLLCLI